MPLLSPHLAAEVAELHSVSEDAWSRISNLTDELRTAGALPTGAGGASGSALSTVGGLGAPNGAAAASAAATVRIVPRETLEALKKLRSDFAAIQQQAFRIGRESEDNTALANHPSMNDYVQSLREMRPRLKKLISDLEQEVELATGRPAEKPPQKKKSPKTIQGLSEEEIRSRTRRSVAEDTRPFRVKAMDIVSRFQERQMEMQDKQRDLQLAMDGPDWPKEDWPLTTADAKHVGDAETMITGTLQKLNARLVSVGGLGRVHESDDVPALEQLAALCDMMFGYGELIDRHVVAVKKVYRINNKKSRPRSESRSPPSGGDEPVAGASLRDRMLNFGGEAGSGASQPFSWLRESQDVGVSSAQSAGAPPASGIFSGYVGTLPTGSFGSPGSFGSLGGGGLGGLNSFGVGGASTVGTFEAAHPRQGGASAAPGLGSFGIFGAPASPAGAGQQVGTSGQFGVLGAFPGSVGSFGKQAGGGVGVLGAQGLGASNRVHTPEL